LFRRGVDIGGGGARAARPASPTGRETGMSRMGREVDVAPRAGVAVSAALGLAAATAFFFVGRGFPPPARLLFSACFALFSFAYGFLVCYVWGDARRRGMRHRIWAL